MPNLKKRLPEVLNANSLKELNVETQDFFNCRIIKERTGSATKKPVPVEMMPGGSVARFERTGRTNLLGLDMDGGLWAIEPPAEIEKGKDPTIFYSYMETIPTLVERAVPMSGRLGEKIKFGVFIGLIVVELVFIFLIGAALGG